MQIAITIALLLVALTSWQVARALGVISTATIASTAATRERAAAARQQAEAFATFAERVERALAAGSAPRRQTAPISIVPGPAR